MKRLLIILLMVSFVKFAYCSEIVSIPVEGVITKSEIILEAKLEHTEKQFIEKIDGKFIDSSFIYYFISDSKILKGRKDSYLKQVLFYKFPYPHYRRDAEGNRYEFRIYAKIDGSGNEFILETGKRYIFFIKEYNIYKVQVIRVEESSTELIDKIQSNTGN